jgi:hypothetical protein
VFDVKVFVEQMSIPIARAVAYPVNENKPPFGVLVPSVSNFQSLFGCAKTQVFLRLLEYPASGVIVAIPAGDKAGRVGFACGNQPDLDAIAYRDGGGSAGG